MELSIESMQSINEYANKIKKEVSLPFPITTRTLKALVRDLKGDLSIMHVKNPDYKSIIKKTSKGFSIEVFEERKDHYTFGCAHALGHLLLHIGYLSQTDYWKNFTVFEDNYNGTLDEAEAEFFAECFLIPDKMFVEYCEKFDVFDAQHFKELAFQFDVPTKNIIKKGIRLGIIDVNNI